MDERPVTELMMSPVLTVDSDEPTAAVADAMVRKGIRSLIVIDEACNPEGILTSTDYIELVAEGLDPAETTVGERMTTDIVTASVEETVRAAAGRMERHDISHLPVVDDDEQVVGILTTTDLRTFLSEP